MPFRLGLIGAGRMGQTHLRALAGSSSVHIVAVADPSAAAREAVAGTGRSAHPISVHSSTEAMLGAGGLDGVLIAAPTRLHLENIRLAAAAGLPILCEKPCGLTAAEARAAASVGVRLQVAYWRRFVPALQRLRTRIAAGAMGEVYFVASAQWDGAPPQAAFRAESGGIFIDMGVHEFDQIRWLTGQQVTAMRVATPKICADPPVAGDAESAQVLCDLSGGSTALVSLGRRFPLGDVCRVEVYGTRDFEDCRFLWPPDADATFHAALRRQAEAFAAGDTSGATAADAIAALGAAAEASRFLQTLGENSATAASGPEVE
jgi:myo-inositol 2-dehydrogenase / D-chiro-inositol 1-dehydrogenase